MQNNLKRKPNVSKNSDKNIMALTQQVEESLRDAQSQLKNALAYSARNEESYISKHIADMLMQIDNLILVDSIKDKLCIEDDE